MSPTPRWSDITEDVRNVRNPIHDQVVAIMQSLDRRYRKLGSVLSGPEPRTRLSDWVAKGANGLRANVLGAVYTDEPAGPLRRVFAITHDPASPGPGWQNMRIEILGVDHEHPSHRDPEQWNDENFEAWSDDLRRVLVALGTTGNPNAIPQPGQSVRLKAYRPPDLDWKPMEAFHHYIINRLDRGRGGTLVHPAQPQPSTDWVDYELIVEYS